MSLVETTVASTPTTSTVKSEILLSSLGKPVPVIVIIYPPLALPVLGLIPVITIGIVSAEAETSAYPASFIRTDGT